MDVSKFALDRTAYLNSAAANALYDSTKAGAYGSAYLDPTSMLTKAYFDSKMYQDRANYAFDISKIYGQQQQQQQQHLLQNGGGNNNNNNNNNNSIDERDSSSQLSDSQSTGGDKGGGGQMMGGDNQVDTTMSQYVGGPYQGYTSAQGSSGDFRRPLTVIFWPNLDKSYDDD